MVKTPSNTLTIMVSSVNSRAEMIPRKKIPMVMTLWKRTNQSMELTKVMMILKTCTKMTLHKKEKVKMLLIKIIIMTKLMEKRKSKLKKQRKKRKRNLKKAILLLKNQIRLLFQQRRRKPKRQNQRRRKPRSQNQRKETRNLMRSQKHQ